jgi:archaemetzincin
MELQNIALVSFGYWDDGFLQKIANYISSELFVKVQIIEGHLDFSEYYDAARRQYNANNILQQIEKHYAIDNTKTIGLSNIDLFIPIFTYIFGQAYLGGQYGIISIFRLSSERYGMPADDALLLERSGKEVIHELGHAFGLIHCLNTDCVMHGGSYVEDIDQKTASFCINCKKKLENAPNNSVITE